MNDITQYSARQYQYYVTGISQFLLSAGLDEQTIGKMKS
jgi:hypothetical protein